METELAMHRAHVEDMEQVAWHALGKPEGTHETSNVQRLADAYLKAIERCCKAETVAIAMAEERDAAKAAGVKRAADELRGLQADLWQGAWFILSSEECWDKAINAIDRRIAALESEAGAEPASAKLAEKREDFEREVDEVAGRRDEALRELRQKVAEEHSVSYVGVFASSNLGKLVLMLAKRALGER